VSEVDELSVVGAVDAVFDEAFLQVAGRFPRFESRRQARLYVRGLVAGLERKNSWELAEHAGDVSPDRMQRLLNFSAWDDAGVRADLRKLVAAGLGCADGVLIVDETGFLKKGRMSAGVARQYSGTAGRVENCQLGVFAAYASAAGRALIDAELYVPAAWTDDRERCRQAGIGDEVAFATKPQLARVMIERALAEGMPFAWVAADEAYGTNPDLRAWLEAAGIGYVLAVAKTTMFPTAWGRRQARTLAALVEPGAWERRSAGWGAKGERLYDWALIGTSRPDLQLMVRRSIATGELAFYACHTPTPTPLAELVRVAGSRWAIEELFQTAKTHIGLDHYQVRLYRAWYRHITLAMLALAWLALAATSLQKGRPHLWTTTDHSQVEYAS
jgi:SRSO17 transposase